MTTIAELIQQISFKLHGQTGIKEQLTYLTSAIDATATDLVVANGNQVHIGLIEVDSELMLVEAQDGNNVKLYPFGRGQEGTTAVAHAINAKVTNDPVFPTESIFKAIQEAILEISPDLFQVKKYEFPWNTTHVSYGLPADVDRVLQVSYDTPGPWKMWPKLSRWSYNSDASVADFTNGKSIEVYDGLIPGFNVQVTYAAPYTVPTTTSDTFASLGVQETMKDVIMFNVCWRLTQSLESSRLQIRSAESRSREEAVEAGAITNLARQFFAMYSQRFAEERRRLLTLHPAPVHWTR